MKLAYLLSLSTVAFAAACGSSVSPNGSGSGGGPTPPGTVEISIQDFSFAPANITVKAGTTVRWTNHGPSAHTTTSDLAGWDSPSLSPPGGGGGYGGGGSVGAAFSYKFTQVGTYGYHCSIHPPSLYPNFKGSVTVTP